jgi:hypothetical protein
MERSKFFAKEKTNILQSFPGYRIQLSMATVKGAKHEV